jgi:hypothetical protein
MIGFMHYNKFGNDGFTDRGKGRTVASVQTCPVCLCAFSGVGGVLPDGTTLAKEDWVKQVCKAVKDDTVNGGYQAGCFASAYPAF